jgi:hypothetical protein
VAFQGVSRNPAYPTNSESRISSGITKELWTLQFLRSYANIKIGCGIVKKKGGI